MRCVRGAASRSFLPIHSVPLSGHQKAMQNRAEREQHGMHDVKNVAGWGGAAGRLAGGGNAAPQRGAQSLSRAEKALGSSKRRPVQSDTHLCVQASRGQDAKSQQQLAILCRLRQYPATPAVLPYIRPTYPPWAVSWRRCSARRRCTAANDCGSSSSLPYCAMASSSWGEEARTRTACV